jgi:hypothetical protein
MELAAEAMRVHAIGLQGGLMFHSISVKPL